jgi:hypothetical protein
VSGAFKQLVGAVDHEVQDQRVADEFGLRLVTGDKLLLGDAAMEGGCWSRCGLADTK